MAGMVRILTLAMAAITVWPMPAGAAGECVHPWAKPGRYTISGQFQDRVQTTTAYLTKGCRVSFNLPGVSSGGPVAADGPCVRFTFKVRDVAQVFTARWCDTYATVPWRGRDVRVEVSRARTPGN